MKTTVSKSMKCFEVSKCLLNLYTKVQKTFLRKKKLFFVLLIKRVLHSNNLKYEGIFSLIMFTNVIVYNTIWWPLININNFRAPLWLSATVLQFNEISPNACSLTQTTPRASASLASRNLRGRWVPMDFPQFSAADVFYVNCLAISLCSTSMCYCSRLTQFYGDSTMAWLSSSRAGKINKKRIIIALTRRDVVVPKIKLRAIIVLLRVCLGIL